MAMATTTTLADLMQEGIGECMAAARIQPIFWPGAPAYPVLMVHDATGGEEAGFDFNRYGTLTAYDRTEGEVFNEVQSLDPTSVNVDPTDSQVITWITNKALRRLKSPNAKAARMKAEAEEHVLAHQDKFDIDIFALFTGLTVGKAHSGNPPTVAGIQEAKVVLRKLKAPGPYVGFLSEQNWYDLTVEASSALADASKSGQIGEELWRDYEIKRFLNTTWFITDNVYNDGTDAFGGIISPRCLGVVLEQLPTVTTVSDTSAEAVKRDSTMFSTVASYKAAVVDATMGVYLKFDYD